MAFNIVFGGPMTQTLTGIDNTNNELVGDVHTMTDQAKAGNDTLIGGNYDGNNFMFNDLFGDALTMLDSARGGNDTLIGGNNTATGAVILENDLSSEMRPPCWTPPTAATTL